mgnify:CR=1 FL=1
MQFETTDWLEDYDKFVAVDLPRIGANYFHTSELWIQYTSGIKQLLCFRRVSARVGSGFHA